MDWENLRYFLAVIEHGSLAGAARALAVERTTISRRIRSLERETGLCLFDRRGKRLQLTTAGHDLAAAAQPMATAAVQAQRRAAGMKPGIGGRIRISAPPAFAAARLVAPLVGLRRCYPDLDIQLLGEMRTVSLSRGEADIAIRLNRPETGDLAISKLCSMAFHLYARADYLAETHASHRRYIGQGDDPGALPQQVALNRIAKGQFSFYTDDISLQLAAALAGGGIAVLPDFAVEGHKDLVRLEPEAPVVVREVWSVTHSELRNQASIRAVLKTLRAALKGTTK